MAKSIEEINRKIKEGKAVVFTAEEIIDVAREKGIKKTAQEVDVVTTGTFGIMCSSAAYFNVGHTTPQIKLGGGRTYLNDVQPIRAWRPSILSSGLTPYPTTTRGTGFTPGNLTTAGDTSSRNW